MNKNAQIILDTINASTDHPTAEQVYLHLKECGTKVSMAVFMPKALSVKWLFPAFPIVTTTSPGTTI